MGEAHKDDEWWLGKSAEQEQSTMTRAGYLAERMDEVEERIRRLEQERAERAARRRVPADEDGSGETEDVPDGGSSPGTTAIAG